MKLVVTQPMMLDKFLHYQQLLIICFQAHQHILSLTVSKPAPLSVDADILHRPVSPTVTVDGRNSSVNNKHFRKYIFMVEVFSRNLKSLKCQLKIVVPLLFVLLKDGFVRKIIYIVYKHTANHLDNNQPRKKEIMPSL